MCDGLNSTRISLVHRIREFNWWLFGAGDLRSQPQVERFLSIVAVISRRAYNGCVRVPVFFVCILDDETEKSFI